MAARDERFDHTDGPWEFDGICQIVDGKRPHMRVAFLPSDHAKYASSKANGRLIAAAPDLLEAAELLEKAELARQDCDECEDEGEPEACGKCFPAFDEARVKRRLAIAKARGNAAEYEQEMTRQHGPDLNRER